MSKDLEVHLEGLLGDVKEAQEILDTVLSYNTADLWSASSFVTLLKRRKMAKAEAVLGRLSEGLSSLSPDFLPAAPGYDATKGQYWDYVLNYSVTKDTKAVKAELDQLGAAIEQRLAEVRAYLADQE